jgi:cell division protein FtsB
VRFLIAVLIILLLTLQYKLWMGKGGYLDVRQLESELLEQRSKNETLLSKNRALQAEVEDLKKGLAAIEERAREELGMIQQGETFYQIVPPPQTEDSEDKRSTDEP